MELDQETLWNIQVSDLGHSFLAESRVLSVKIPSGHLNPLANIMMDTLTKLWDFGFTQTEIREAFTKAIADLPSYAAGEERRR